MRNFTDALSARERREIEAVAAKEAERIGVAKPSLEDMAVALLRAHLVLIRDCPGVLPSSSAKLPGAKSDRGVSLGDCSNASA